MLEEPTIGSRIREARRAADLTQRGLADLLGVPIGIVERLETGVTDPAPYLQQIADKTSTNIAWLRAGEDDETAGRRLEATEADLAARQQALLRAERRLRDAADAIESRWRELQATEELQQGRVGEIDQRERLLAEREDALAALEPHYAAAQRDLDERTAALEAREQEIAGREETEAAQQDDRQADVAGGRVAALDERERELEIRAAELDARAEELHGEAALAAGSAAVRELDARQRRLEQLAGQIAADEERLARAREDAERVRASLAEGDRLQEEAQA